MVTGDGKAYRYLQESAFEFPYREDFLALMTATNMFQSTEYRSLMGGVSYIYKGRKLTQF
jgi:ubiquinone/menaquinone biosynthesis C-methylase UbiE